MEDENFREEVKKALTDREEVQTLKERIRLLEIILAEQATLISAQKTLIDHLTNNE